MLSVLRVVDDHARKSTSAILCIATIAKCLLVSRRTVERSIADLEGSGLLIVSRRRRRDGGRGPSQYTIDWVVLRALQPEKDDDATMRQTDASHSQTVVTHQQTDESSRQTDVDTMRQTDARNNRLSKRISQPPPQPECTSDLETGNPNDTGSDWEAVGRVFVDVGIANWRNLLEDCKEGECPPEHILAIVAYWETRTDLEVGSLYRQIQNAHPDRSPNAGWLDSGKSGPPTETELQVLERLAGSKLSGMGVSELAPLVAKSGITEQELRDCGYHTANRPTLLKAVVDHFGLAT